MKHSIALKIFALAVGIIALTVVVAITTNIEVIGLGGDVATVARKTIPLAAKAADLNEAGLFRRIAFERLYREYGEPQPDAETIKQAAENFEKNTTRVYELAAQLRDDLKVLPDEPQARELAAQTREVVGQIESSFASTTDLARSTLAARKAGDRPKAKELLEFTFKGQTELRTLRNKLQDITGRMAEISAIRAEHRKNRVLISSSATTLLAVVLGLGAAWVISRNMAKPVLELLRTTRAVQGGNLSAHVGKLPEDEIGQLGDSFNAMVDELKRKENLQKAIGSYIDPRIVEKVILPGRPEDVAGQKRVMTVLFADLVGFTTLGENLTPGGLVNVINRYFTLMSECVREEHGIIDKFIGDAIMAYWGPPFVAEEEQAAAACRAALRQVEALARFRTELPELMGLRKNVPEINLRIGLATGEVIVGNIGSETARSYTVMGDVVNLASRLESANNVYGTRILISEETGRMASRIVETREVDSIAVKGKTDPVQVYELLSLQGKLSPELDKRRLRFAEGLEAYRKQAWPAAEMIFQELVEKYADAPARAFLERVKILRQHPPGAGWDGVWRMMGK
ncbi:MAG: adenylate/guanylate cyclase domain-containing protein [Verrucomicrobia bacterium]|nr:adenylate/guanylate cyclase domain-containing protein [Verrucomicrobiota bacterium]